MPPRSLRRLLPALLFLAPAAATAQAPTPLTPGQPMADSLGADDVHTYTLTLDADRFVYAEADQQSVDVVVTVVGPDGGRVKQVDVSARGPEPFQFATTAAGDYHIEVTPFERQAGRYALVVARVEPVATTPEGKADQLVAAYDRPDTPGGVVAVVRGGEVVYARAFGLANLAHDVPFTPETRTNIGSTSKQFTAFALVLLAQQGRVELDADVRTYLPELPDLGAPVTLRHLLNHTSGYREFLNLLAIGGMQPEDEFDHDRVLDIPARQPSLQNAPGAEWNYNNTGYALLAMVVERVTGEPFGDWMAAHVFAPLGMDDTVVRTVRGQVIDNSAEGYAPVEGGWRFAQDLDGAYGAGCIYTTVGDLARWMGNFSDPHLGGPDAFAAMTERGVLTSGDTLEYALGLVVDEHRGLRRVQHGGADIAHRAQFAFYPDLEAGVIALSNNATFNAGEAAEGVAETFFAEHMAPAEPPAPDEAAGPFDPASFDPATFDDYAGRYALVAAPTFILAFSRDGDRYFTQATGQPQVEIFPTSDSTFTLRVVEASVTFHRERDGAVQRITLHQNGDHAARRLEEEAWAPTAEDLAAYAGRYFSDEVEAFYTLAVEDGKLVARHRRLDDVTLTPGEAPDHFAGSNLALMNVAFERDGDGAVTGFRVSNGRARGVLFERFER